MRLGDLRLQVKEGGVIMMICLKVSTYIPQQTVISFFLVSNLSYRKSVTAIHFPILKMSFRESSRILMPILIDGYLLT